MSTKYLADCVFNNLFAQNTVKSYLWKNINNQTTMYYTSFYLEGSRTLHYFQIFVVDGTHTIDGFSLEVFSKVHNISIEEIKTKCKITK